jgi:hypothetical protein
MFAWKVKRDFEDQIQKLCTTDARADGVNRRAISLVPVPAIGERHEIRVSADLRYRQLLIYLEANQSTCCLRIISPSRKSRSAILIYRGLVIGCLYGSKNLEHQIFGESAHQHAVNDLAQPDSIVDAYVLTEEIVLAAASLFHGNVMQTPANKLPHEIYYQAVDSMLASNSVGCIVISDNEGIAVCMIYLFASKIVGAYSFADGWLTDAYDAGLACLREYKDAKVMASALNAANESEAVQMCFSLSGLCEAPPDREDSRFLEMTMHSSTAGEQYRTALQLTHMESRDSGQLHNRGKRPIIKPRPGMYSIAPEIF